VLRARRRLPPLPQVLLGDMGAGKSSLVLRFVKGQFFDFQARGAPGALCFLERASDTLLALRGGRRSPPSAPRSSHKPCPSTTRP
jgi:GTPase SAR1 family protein